MSVSVRAIGSAEGVLYLSRVPAVGEYVTLHGLPRRVARVEHQSLPWPVPYSIPGVEVLPATLPLQIPAVAATITVED